MVVTVAEKCVKSGYVIVCVNLDAVYLAPQRIHSTIKEIQTSWKDCFTMNGACFHKVFCTRFFFGEFNWD